MESVFSNGGVIGATLDYNSTDLYVMGTTTGRLEPTYVGGGTWSDTSMTSNKTVTFPTLTGGIASAPAEGDVVFVSFGFSWATDAALSATGWTEISDLYSSDTEDAQLAVYYKRMGAVPDTSLVITSTQSTASISPTAIFHVWRNLDATTPIDVTSVTTTGTNTAVPAFGAITPVTENSVILVTALSATKESTTPYTSTLDNFRQLAITEVGGNVFSVIGFGSYSGWASGAYTSPSWGYATTSTSMSYATTVIALRPALGDVPLYGNKKNSGIWNLEAVFDSITPVVGGTFNAWELQSTPTSGSYLEGAVAGFSGVQTILYSGPYTSATSTGSTYSRSTTGATGSWLTGSLPSSSRWGVFMSNGSRIVAAAGNATTLSNAVAYTDNGTTWTAGTTGLDSRVVVGGYMNGKFTLVNRATTGVNYAESANGATWSTGTVGTLGYYGIAYLDGTYIAIPTNSAAARKSTAPLSSWSDSTLTLASDWSSISAGNGTFLVTGASSIPTNYSTDYGATWAQGALPSATGSTTAARSSFINNTFIVVTADGLIHTSRNGITWTTITSTAFSGVIVMRSIVETSNHYYIFGNIANTANYIRSPK